MAALTPLFNYRHNDDVRKYSAKACGQMIHCLTPNEKAEAILRVVFSAFMQSIQYCAEVFPKDTMRQLRALVIACEGVENVAVIGLPMAQEASAVLANCVRHVFERKVDRMQEKSKFTDAELFSEEMEDLKVEDEVDEEIVRGVMEVVGKFLKAFNATYQPTFIQIFKDMYGQIFYKPDATEIEILSAVCIFCDYIEFTGDLMMDNGKCVIMEEMLKACAHTNSDVRHSASYGIGLCSSFMPKEVWAASYGPQALQYIHTIITSPEARTEENVNSTDSAIASLGKIAMNQNTEVTQSWLQCMPLKNDPDEAQAANKFFLQNIAALKQFPETTKVLTELQQLAGQGNLLDAEGVNLLMQAPALLQ